MRAVTAVGQTLYCLLLVTWPIAILAVRAAVRRWWRGPRHDDAPPPPPPPPPRPARPILPRPTVPPIPPIAACGPWPPVLPKRATTPPLPSPPASGGDDVGRVMDRLMEQIDAHLRGSRS